MDTTVTELKEILGSLDQKNFRGLFWRGHGGLYTESDGDHNSLLCTGRKDYTQERSGVQPGPEKKGRQHRAVCASGDQFAINYQFFEKYMSQVSGGMFFLPPRLLGTGRQRNSGYDPDRKKGWRLTPGPTVR